MSTHYGNVASDGNRQVYESRSRFVALVDVLGMKSWISKVGPEEPASELNDLMRMAREATSGTQDGVPFGPLVGAALLSDSVLAYSVDDSWASLHVMGDFLFMLVRAALDHGVPMRGAMSVGKVVIDRGRGVFVGTAIADAYLSDKDHGYRGVGVHVTDCARTQLAARTETDRPELHLLHAFSPALFHGAQARGESFVWFENSLFVDHWGAEYTAGNADLETYQKAAARLEEAFGRRCLPESDAIQSTEIAKKLEQSRQFLRDRFRHRSETRWGFDLPPEVRSEAKLKDRARLNAIGLRDGDALVR